MAYSTHRDDNTKMFNSDWLELPSKNVWDARMQWFEELESTFVDERASYGLSEQACALVGEVQMTFCAGAWITVQVMAMAVIEAHLREFVEPSMNTEKLINTFGPNLALDNLRKRRNRILHLQTEHPAITVDQQWSDRTKLEEEAKEAVKLMFEVFYSDVGT